MPLVGVWCVSWYLAVPGKRFARSVSRADGQGLTHGFSSTPVYRFVRGFLHAKGKHLTCGVSLVRRLVRSNKCLSGKHPTCGVFFAPRGHLSYGVSPDQASFFRAAFRVLPHIFPIMSSSARRLASYMVAFPALCRVLSLVAYSTGLLARNRAASRASLDDVPQRYPVLHLAAAHVRCLVCGL